MTFSPKHIMVPVDADATADKELAVHLVEDAVSLAETLGARLTLVHVALPVVASLSRPIDSLGPAMRAMGDVLEARNADAARTLRGLAELALRRGRTVDTMLVTESGSIPELIVRTAENVGADLLVIGTHGRRGIKRVVLGSVAERAAHLSRIPVLLLPPRRLASGNG